MASAKVKDYNCLICASTISNHNIKQVYKLDALFLLQILLEISQDSQLFKNIQNALNCIEICDICTSEIKQCKEIYSEICEKIERFWVCQNKILEKFSQTPNIHKYKRDDWVFQCRKFVKDHDFTGFGYPFAVQDLETLEISFGSLPQLFQDEVNYEAKIELPVVGQENTDNLQISEDPLNDFTSPSNQPSEQGESLPIKQEPESEPEDETADIQQDEDYLMDSEDDDDISSEYDSDYEPSPSKKAKLSPAPKNSRKTCVKQVSRQITQNKRCSNRNKMNISGNYPNFERDPITNKFHCTWPNNCSQQFVDKQYLQYHWDRHRGTPSQKCEECTQAFYSHRVLARHTQMEHPKNGDEFDCKKCGKKCHYREALLKHEKSYHSKKEEERRMAKMKKKEEDPIKKDPLTNKWMCYWPDCDKSYLDRADLNFHLDRHKGTPQQKCEECGEVFFSKKQLVRHTQKEHEKDTKYECEICGKKFDTSDTLRHHKDYMHSEKGTGVEVVCEICGKTYKKGGLKSHMKYIHGSEETGEVERKFVCHLCPGRFKDERSLKRHLWRVHQFYEREEDKEKFERYKKQQKEKRKDWTCHVKGCRMKYVTEEGLKKHVDGVHKGKWDQEEDPDGKFKCEVCGKRFHMKQKLTRHVKQHEKD